MPRKRKPSEVTAAAAGVTIPPELLDQRVPGPMTAAEVQAVCLGFKKALIERAMAGELSHHLGYGPGNLGRRARTTTGTGRRPRPH
jgi:putative transposase